MENDFKNGRDMKRTLDKLAVVRILLPADLPISPAAVAADLNVISPALARGEVISPTATKDIN